MSLRDTLALVATCGALSLVSTGCGGDADLFVRQVQRITPETGCIASSDPAEAGSGSGTLDLLYATAYEQSLLIGTELDERIQLVEAEIEVFDFSGSALSSYTLPISGFIDSADDPRAGYGVAEVVLVDGAAVAFAGMTPQTLVSRVIVRGATLDGDEVVSEPWDFPVRVCTTSIGDPRACLGCEARLAEEAIHQPCRPGQDEPPDCRLMDEALSP